MESRDPARYTVGWICAVGVEYVAAQEFLDDEHPQLAEQHQNDDNIYTLGSIGAHNVVIACMPHGSYGTASAAAVARDVLRTFPNIKFGLMVGIGGGAPTKKQDIRLGDIVVSTIARENGAVLQYDFGKTIQDQAFRTTGFLDAPPRLLTAAVQDLKARYERRGNGLDESVNDVLSNNRRLRKRYGRPPQTCDRLYKSEFLHPDANESCDLQCAKGYDQLIPREERDGDEDDMTTVHYGLIASGNALIKDAIMRDRLAQEKGVLCFEMEAAGLMNHFKCLVIRGICDYADTHKNDDWQGYAAMAAAAYAKDLLQRIPPSKVDAEQSLKLATIAKDTLEVKMIATETNAQISNMAVNHQIQRVKDWLSPPEPSINFNKALKQRHGSTGQWFLESELYQSWKSTPNAFLWLYARPGCGKTVLSSTVIEDLRTSDAGSKTVLYFYFTFNDVSKQSAENMLRSLAFQLYVSVPRSRDLLDRALCAQQPSFHSLCDIFTKMIQAAGPVAIVLDALDECSQRDGTVQDALSWVKSFRTWAANVHLLITSRNEDHIRSMLDTWVQVTETLELRGEMINSDISHYVHDAVRTHDGLKRWRAQPAVQDEIEQTLVEKADGMFRWVSCQLEVLRSCRTLPNLRARLSKLPPTLEATYTRILENIPDDDLPSAIRILQFLTYVDEPIEVEALVEAIAVDLDGQPVFREENCLPDPSEISAYCPSLISITDEYGPFAQLAHFSVREWLRACQSSHGVASQLGQSHAREAISLVSMSYIAYRELTAREAEDYRDFPLYRLAKWDWAANTRYAETSSAKVRDMATAFCRERGPEHHRPRGLGGWSYPGFDWSLLFRLDLPDDDALRLAWGLLSACHYGIASAVEQIIEAGADPKGHPGCPCTPLRAATQEGHIAIMSLLLHKFGAPVDGACSDCQCNTPLAIAAYQGNEAAVRFLLNAGARVDHAPSISIEDIYGPAITPLIAACDQGRFQIVQLLVEAGADLNATVKSQYKYLYALDAACRLDQVKIVLYLQGQGVLIDPRQSGDGGILSTAIRKGLFRMAWLFLRRGVDSQSAVVRSAYGRLLAAACESSCYRNSSNIEHLKYLAKNQNGGKGHSLEGALDLSSRPPPQDACLTDLSWHCENIELSWRSEEFLPFCKVLIEGGADVNANETPWSSPLESACRYADAELFTLLLKYGADVNFSHPWRDDDTPWPGTALGAALEGMAESTDLRPWEPGYRQRCDVETYSAWMKFLEKILSEGANPDAIFERRQPWENRRRESPLMYASKYLPGVPGLLLECGADPNMKGDTWTPLQYACMAGNPNIDDIKALLKAGADVNAGERVGPATSLQLVACNSGNVGIAVMLLTHGASINPRAYCDDYASAIYAAAYTQAFDLVDFLVANGAHALEAELGGQAALAGQNKCDWGI